MINLLPPSYRQSLKANRSSTLMKRWLVLTWLAVFGLIIILASGWFYINQQSKNLTQSINSTQTLLNNADLAKTQKDAKNLTNNIKTINKVLSSEIRFSDLIQDIGSVIPPHTILDSLTLSQVNGAIDLSAKAKDYASAAQIAVNLSDPANKIFSKVDIVSVSCANTATQYPCSGVYRALFNKSTQSRYLGVAKEVQ